MLKRWESAPHARYAHPREDHLVPLFVAAGAAGAGKGSSIYSDTLMSVAISSFRFDQVFWEVPAAIAITIGKTFDRQSFKEFAVCQNGGQCR